MPYLRSLIIALPLLVGCSAIPEVVHEPQFHNPFPQLHKIAVLPFYNQSAEPTVDQELVAQAYYNELQQIPGFEVVPVGVVKQLMRASGFQPSSGEDFQRLAQYLGVDAVVVGSVTEYSPYYPPRLGLSVRWYAANPCFHPVPAGYGLPWGTAEEEFIPDSLVFEAEFALAQEQLATQTPGRPAPALIATTLEQPEPVEELPVPGANPPASERPRRMVPPRTIAPELLAPVPDLNLQGPGHHATTPSGPALPPDWPDPRGFVPPGPSALVPECLPQSEPILSLTRLYHGNDADFTKRLANYFYFRDEARFGGWEAYLQRSEDFIRFCCHLHIADLLAARGGAGKTRVVWRWPIGRYDR